MWLKQSNETSKASDYILKMASKHNAGITHIVHSNLTVPTIADNMIQKHKQRKYNKYLI